MGLQLVFGVARRARGRPPADRPPPAGRPRSRRPARSAPAPPAPGSAPPGPRPGGPAPPPSGSARRSRRRRCGRAAGPTAVPAGAPARTASSAGRKSSARLISSTSGEPRTARAQTNRPPKPSAARARWAGRFKRSARSAARNSAGPGLVLLAGAGLGVAQLQQHFAGHRAVVHRRQHTERQLQQAHRLVAGRQGGRPLGGPAAELQRLLGCAHRHRGDVVPGDGVQLFLFGAACSACPPCARRVSATRWCSSARTVGASSSYRLCRSSGCEKLIAPGPARAASPARRWPAPAPGCPARSRRCAVPPGRAGADPARARSPRRWPAAGGSGPARLASRCSMIPRTPDGSGAASSQAASPLRAPSRRMNSVANSGLPPVRACRTDAAAPVPAPPVTAASSASISAWPRPPRFSVIDRRFAPDVPQRGRGGVPSARHTPGSG